MADRHRYRHLTRQTMVTAGIYMIARSHVLFSLVQRLHLFLAIGLFLTALMAASIGSYQNDIKKVLHIVTVSQLGYVCSIRELEPIRPECSM